MTTSIGICNQQDAFRDTEDDESSNSHIHIRIQQRNGRKTLTTVQGVHPRYDFKKIVKVAKKEFSCNGTVIDHPEYGEVIQLQGDQRESMKEMLVKFHIAAKEQLKVHGF